MDAASLAQPAYTPLFEGGTCCGAKSCSGWVFAPLSPQPPCGDPVHPTRPGYIVSSRTLNSRTHKADRTTTTISPRTTHFRVIGGINSLQSPSETRTQPIAQ